MLIGGGQKNLKLKKYKVLFVLIFIYFLCGVGVTYAYFAFREENTSVIVGNVVNVDADLSVELVVGNNDGLVPMTDAALSNAINGVGSDNGACVDSLGNLSCQVYKITLTNNGSRLQHLKGTIKLNSGTSDEDLYVNLRWQELSDTTTIKENSVVNKMSKSTLVSDLTMESKETKTWYVAVWLSETDYDQTYSDTGEFGGEVTFEAGNVIDGELNEYGFYYEKLYETEIEEGTMAVYSFYEDGSVDIYIGDEFYGTQPAGSAVYELNTITMDGLTGTVSSDGTSISLNAIYNSEIEETDLELNEYGFYYEKLYTLAAENGSESYLFYEDGSVDIYYDGEFSETQPTGSAVYEVGTITFDGLTGTISNDGMTISFFYLTMYLTNEESYSTDLQFEQFYSLVGMNTINYYVGYALKFYENEMVDVYYDDSLYETVLVSYGNNSVTFTSTLIGYMSFNVSNDGVLLVNSNGSSFILGTGKFEIGDYMYYWDGDGDGWSVDVLDQTKSSYGVIREELNGFPIVDLSYTFYNCGNLITSPIISNTVTNMANTFYNCIDLEGEVEINANPTGYESAFYDTVKPITITGSSTEETKANLAGTANNGNVSY